MSPAPHDSGSPRILFFSPYARWLYHTANEVTWAHALRLRGAEVRFVLCNGLSGACDIYRENLNPRDELSCLDCQATTAQRFADYAMPYEWLGAYLDHRVRAQAERWAADVPRDSLLDAKWKGLPVGEWAAASCYTQFRTAKLDVLDPKVEGIVREFLIGTVIFTEATDALLEDYKPDSISLLNGRFFAHWVVIELAKKRGIRFVTHERGLRGDSVRFALNARLHDLSTNRNLWEHWREVPLNRDELEDAATILHERRHGKNYSRLSFSPPPQDGGDLMQSLGLNERPIVAVFNSSDDEVAGFPERRAGAFPESNDFLPAIVEIARRMPEVQFVLRLHPNIMKKEVGANEDALSHGREVADGAPENVCVVHPEDDISSYTLADLARVAIVYASTIGLEIAATGKPVLCVAQATYSHTSCVEPVADPGDLEPALRAALSRESSIEIARTAMRWTYRYFREYSLPFDLVREEENYEASLNYGDFEALQPGGHAVLDAICGLIDGRIDSVLADPSAAERDRNTDEEDLFLTRRLREFKRLETPGQVGC